MNSLAVETTQKQYQQPFIPSLQSMPEVASKENTPEGDNSAPRKRTRASPEQLAVLEKTFSVNPSPNNRVREQLSRELGMSERSIQIWFQNRRAKVKNIAKRSSILYDETLRMQHYASAAATAACQAAAFQQQQNSHDAPVKANPDLYYYYYYYYFNQQQQQQQQRQKQMYFPSHYMSSAPTSEFPPPASLKLMPPPPPPPPVSSMDSSTSPSNTLASDMTPQQQSWARKQMSYQGLGRTRAHTIGPYPTVYQEHIKSRIYQRGASVELPSYKQTLNSDTIPEYSNASNFNSSMLPPPPSFRMTESPTSTDGMAANNFGSLSVNDSVDVSYQSLPFFEQPQQMNWTELPFYGDQALLNTPTSMPDCNTIYYQSTTADNTNLISAEALQVGTWKRMGFQPQDLSCFFDKQRSVFVWCIRDGIQRFKMEFNQDALQGMKLEPLQERAGWARLEIKVIPTQISFYMEATPNGNWVQCRDYTEDKQASVVKAHYLDGPALALRAELDQLVQGNPELQKILSMPTTKPVSAIATPVVESTMAAST